MAADLKSELAKVYHLHAAFAGTTTHPPYCDLAISECYKRFCTELAGKEFRDPRGKSVVIHEDNFPKLLGMKLADPQTGQPMIDPNSGKQRKAKANRVLAELKTGKFVDAAYTVEIGRVRTLFWVPDVITDPHAIHPNAHPVVAGDEVYVKRYDKNGSEVKLVVMGPSENRGRVIITSFLTDISDLGNYIKEAAIWTKK